MLLPTTAGDAVLETSRAPKDLPPLPRLFSTREVAEILGMSRRFVQKLIASGYLPHMVVLGPTGLAKYIRVAEPTLRRYLREAYERAKRRRDPAEVARRRRTRLDR